MARHKLKLTVLKRTDPEKYFDEYPVEKEDWFVPCGIYEDNQEIIVEDNLAMPEGFCQSAWMAIYPTVRTLGYGGNLPFFKKEGVAVSCCTDGMRPVVFMIERI